MSETDPDEETYRYPIPDDEAPSRAAYVAVAAAKGCDALDLPPLARYVDPDALDAIVDRATDSDGPTSTFQYAGYSVTITVDEVRVVR